MMQATPQGAPVLSVRDLGVQLPAGGDRALAVREVSFDVHPGRTVCLIGESGSGKSVIAQTVMGLLAPGLRPVAGRVELQGEDLLQATPQRLRQLRGAAMGMVFQEPMTALNPVQRCGEQVDEMLRQHTRAGRRRAPPAGAGGVRAGAPARAGPHLRVLPAPAVGRPAPAHRDRHRADPQARPC